MPDRLNELESLVRAAPDPESDREALLELQDSGSPQAHVLAERLLNDETWRSSQLGKLLPGLSLIDAPNFLIRLSERAVNPILRADLATLRALAMKTPAELLALRGIGKGFAREVLTIAMSEWAAAYLGEAGKEQGRPRPPADDAAPFDPREHQRRLSDAFDEIEKAVGFEAFRCRKLDPGEVPSQSEVAAALGLKPEQVPHYERAISNKLAQRMRDEGSPLSVAVATLKDGIGALGRPHDLERTLAEVDPLERAMPKGAPQRRSLLLLLANLRETHDWIIDVEIEEIVLGLFKGLTEAVPADLDVVDRLLARLGIKKDLRIPWVVAQPGYRITEQKLMRIDGD